ncbi:low temperature requirement protein A [Micromonospora sp. NBC_01796]|uniref:low temperature requirement protein A n=1 Tax=Micromonospora sp. NBC_01796 TaxID=2975987 RepID=UPI002DD97D3A|nr:low temperature requirement protein A [Micromonospora sp. NBC_01796]WSA83022.1 low temperature requirement protein A [Micromonospora sp. NBC_01796]
MAGNLAARLLRKREHPRQASALELFFDLAFIFGLTLLSRRLFDDLSWGNLLETLILFAATYWIWIATAWSTDWYNPNEPIIRGLVLSIMFVGLVMVSAIPSAFGPHGLIFAGAYVLIHLGRGVLLLSLLRGHPLQRRSLLVLIWFSISAVPWLVGAFLPEPERVALWLVALVIDYGIAWLGWPTPGLGRVPEENLRNVGEHLSERYQQVFIIALGEVILVNGLTYATAGITPLRTLAFGLSFLNVVLLWRGYLIPGGLRIGGILDQNRPRMAVSVALCHALVIAGTLLTAVGNEVLIIEPLSDPRGAWVMLIVGGAALFLFGRFMFHVSVFRRLPWPGLVGLVILGLLSPVLLLLRPMVVSLVTNLALFGAVAVDVYLLRRSVREGRIPPPPGGDAL